jgi:hypothetical protein
MKEFNSQICTTREQSERLLALGLKKETADMHWYKPVEFEHDYWFMGIGSEWCGVRDIPAWSLHRIMSIVYSNKPKKNGLGLAIIQYDNPFEDMIQKIEWLIKEGYFNKEYLV